MQRPALDPRLLQAYERHDQAEARGERVYADPVTGFAVLTATSHRQRGTCCGSACRHCPYDWENVDATRFDDVGPARQRRRELEAAIVAMRASSPPRPLPDALEPPDS